MASKAKPKRTTKPRKPPKAKVTKAQIAEAAKRARKYRDVFPFAGLIEAAIVDAAKLVKLVRSLSREAFAVNTPKSSDSTPAPKRAADEPEIPEPVAPEGYEFCKRDEAERGKGDGYWAFYRVDASTWSGPGWRSGNDHDSEYRFLRKRTTPALPPEIASHWRVVGSFDEAWPMGEGKRAGAHLNSRWPAVDHWDCAEDEITWLTPRTDAGKGTP